ncbi:hypothetical protein [Magnetospira sp. QH-2]|uniref:hypothetical protein n=1 Tax=Magnetospira sp. (strain QH-2) TaxID=1288970 RepID=UPI0003E81358|nr:hypothetical protein [Magnetospira sp. QH-2]CCQ75761.1 Membrane protein of unknown function [Magnetospira sp. QH-2]
MWNKNTSNVAHNIMISDTALALIVVCVAALFGPVDVLAQSGGDWASSIAEKGEEFKTGLISLAGIAVGIGAAWMLTVGAISGDINWKRVGILGFCAIGLMVADQVIAAFVQPVGGN